MARWVTGFILVALAALAPAAWAGPADDYPNRPVRLIVPFPPGGSTDNIGRVLSMKLAEQLGQPFPIDNRGGAGAAIGTDLAAKATPDGYTVLCTTVASLAINPHLTKVPYDPLKDLTPVSMASFGWMALAVPNDLPARTLPEVIALAKARPGKLFFGSPGPGTISQIHGEVFKLAAGIDITHVPYKGSGPATVDLISGQIQLFFESSVLPHVLAGKIRAVAVANDRRWPALPDVPTFTEQGVTGLEQLLSWFGVLVPAGTPPEIVDKLAGAMERILAQPDIPATLAAFGMYPFPIAKEKFGERIRADHAYYGKLIAQTGIKLD